MKGDCLSKRRHLYITNTLLNAIFNYFVFLFFLHFIPIHYTNIFFSNGTKATLLYSLSNMELQINEKLTGMPQPFIRIGRQYIVNSSYIFQINTLKRQLILNCFDAPLLYTLSVSKEALKKLKEVYIQKNNHLKLERSEE